MLYSVKTISTYSVTPGNKKFYEESVYIVKAASFDEAYKKVEKHMNQFDTEHINPKGQTVRTEKIDILDCFLAFDAEQGVQEVYSSFFNNQTQLEEDAFYNAVTKQCSVEELRDLRYQEFNTNIEE